MMSTFQPEGHHPVSGSSSCCQEKAQKKFIEISHAYEARLVKELVLGAVFMMSVDICNQKLGTANFCSFLLKFSRPLKPS